MEGKLEDVVLKHAIGSMFSETGRTNIVFRNIKSIELFLEEYEESEISLLKERYEAGILSLNTDISIMIGKYQRSIEEYGKLGEKYNKLKQVYEELIECCYQDDIEKGSKADRIRDLWLIKAGLKEQ